jgi:hypothetical protein
MQQTMNSTVSTEQRAMNIPQSIGSLEFWTHMNDDSFKMVAENNVENFIDVKDKMLFSDANTFSQYIELRAVTEKKTCTDILLELCAEKDLEPDEIKELLSTSLRGKLINELADAGLCKKPATLDFD